MNTTHIHLLLNHFPIIGTLIGSLLLFWGILRKEHNIKLLAAVLLFSMALVAIPVFLTGEPAEESVEKIPGVSEQMIHLHEEAAEIAIWIMGLTGLSALISLLFAYKKHRFANSFFVFTFILSAICFASMARTGYYGGQIRHSEINSGGSNTEQQNEKEEKDAGKASKTEKEDDD